jgi:choline kinase
MDALIIAAGYGSRLRALSPSKPLTTVAGVPLIELGIRQAAAAGVTRVVVATGHEGELVEGFLREYSKRTSVIVECIRVPDWSRPNGYSVLAGASQIRGDFLLMMADHIFSGSILRHLVHQGREDRSVTLAIDHRVTGDHVDPDDATWVSTDKNGFIRSIGKTIVSYDAVDCGAFLATQELPAAIATAITMGKPGSLSDGMQVLADRKRAATMDIGTAWWIDVDDPRSLAIAEAQASRHAA